MPLTVTPSGAPIPVVGDPRPALRTLEPRLDSEQGCYAGLVDQDTETALWIAGGSLLAATAAVVLSKQTPSSIAETSSLYLRQAAIPSTTNLGPGDLVPVDFIGGVGWVPVHYNGQIWNVSPSYIAPVAIGEAARIAETNGAELPTPGLVDAIWKAADLKLQPLPRQHDGTAATMASKATFDDQYARIMAQIGGRPYKLLAGTHKDVVRDPQTGKIGIYGWHMLSGQVIQPFFPGHLESWIDYSQGLRLVQRVA
jgi:hypothetical protein